MSYGPFNAGNSAKPQEIYKLAADIINGIVKTPLTTASRETICTVNGEEIFAYVNEHERLKLAIKEAIAEFSGQLNAIGYWD